jgi:tetratricopeptide (TPR) repeat protein
LDELGDLPGAIQSFERSMKLHQETGYKQGSGYALSGWGLVLLEQDHLSEARSKIEEALALRQQLAEQSSQAMTWLYLAQLSLEENHPAQAEKLAGDATAQFAKDKSVENESMANAALAQALLAEQKTTEARAAAEQATALSHNTTSLNAFFEAGIASALVETASGNVGEARQQLDRMIQEARSRHYVGYELRARLERGMLELKSSKEARDETSLESLRKEAIAKGYLLIARKSADRLQDSSTIARRQRN